MRATTLSTPKASRTQRADKMLELSPLDTAANPSASSMPASSSTARSKPTPLTVLPAKSGPSRRKDSKSRSITATVWPRFSRLLARLDPTRPQPMITMCTPLSLMNPAVRTLCDAGHFRPPLAARGSQLLYSVLGCAECVQHRQAPPAGPEAPQHSTPRDTSSETHRLAGLRIGRPLLGCLRARRDLPDLVAG